MATQPTVTAADLFLALRRAGELLTDLVGEMEPALERAAAISAGQLSLLDRNAPGNQSEVAHRTVIWAREVLEPLECLLGLAAAPPYLEAQDGIQKRIIRDLREEVISLRARVALLKSLVLENRSTSPN